MNHDAAQKKSWSFWRSARKTVCWILAVLIAYAVIGMLLSLIPVNRHPSPGDDVVVYLERSDVHTDIVVPTRTERIDWVAIVPPSDTKIATQREYLAFGWGSQDFYLNVPTWGDLTLGIALKAISGTGGTALHTEYEHEPTEGANCRRLTITADQYNALVEFILASGKRNESGGFIHIDHDGYYQSDAFYEGIGRYSPFFTCNTWANSALKACGQKACLWTALQQPIFWKYPKVKQ